mgnify:FL=1
MNIQEQINQKQADILTAKAYLYETDWEVIKATELKYSLSDEISQKRAESRDLINLRQAEINTLQEELDLQAEAVIAPIPY